MMPGWPRPGVVDTGEANMGGSTSRRRWFPRTSSKSSISPIPGPDLRRQVGAVWEWAGGAANDAHEFRRNRRAARLAIGINRLHAANGRDGPVTGAPKSTHGDDVETWPTVAQHLRGDPSRPRKQAKAHQDY